MMNDAGGLKRRDGGRRRSLLFRLVPSALCLIFSVGCSKQGDSGATSRPNTLRERQDKALKDPFGYSPDVDRTDISGGGLTGFDRDGIGKDMKNVFDP